MPRKQHSYHYIYKTTCTTTKKYYIGMHSTSNLDDGYLGSGKRLRYSINKHGRSNHQIEILEFVFDRKSLKAREIEIINDELLKDPFCMNLARGGEGGYLIETSEETRKKLSDIKKQNGNFNFHFGMKWSDDVKRKMSQTRQGKKRGPYKLSPIKSQIQLGKKRGPYKIKTKTP